MYTTGEKLRIARLTAQAARQIVKGGHEDAVHPRIQRELDRIEERREQRAAAAFELAGKAETDLARAEAAYRAAKPGKDRDAARRARNDAKDRLRRTESAARKYL